MNRECWNCSETQRGTGAFCTGCGPPMEEFEVKSPRGFLTNRSDIYLENIRNGEISQRDPILDDRWSNRWKRSSNRMFRRRLASWPW
jgi:hypothetical protein